LGERDIIRVKPEGTLPREARHYLELARRSSAFSGGVTSPQRFIQWAHEIGLAFHKDWHDAVGQAGSRRVAVGAAAAAADAKRRKLVVEWARAPYWGPEEGAALAYGLDPKAVVRGSTAGYDRPSLDGPTEARHLRDMALRAIDVSTLDERADPFEFLTWARSVGVEFHADWWGAVPAKATRPEPASEAKPVSDPPKGLGTREQETLLRMVAGMAMAIYGWSANDLRSKETGTI
jgi:hypothetical protein